MEGRPWEAKPSAAGELKSRIPVAAPPPQPAIAGMKALPNISVSLPFSKK